MTGYAPMQAVREKIDIHAVVVYMQFSAMHGGREKSVKQCRTFNYFPVIGFYAFVNTVYSRTFPFASYNGKAAAPKRGQCL